MRMGDVTHIETVAEKAISNIQSHYEGKLRLMRESHEMRLTERFLRGVCVGAAVGIIVSSIFVTTWLVLL